MKEGVIGKTINEFILSILNSCVQYIKDKTHTVEISQRVI